MAFAEAPPVPIQPVPALVWRLAQVKEGAPTGAPTEGVDVEKGEATPPPQATPSPPVSAESEGVAPEKTASSTPRNPGLSTEAARAAQDQQAALLAISGGQASFMSWSAADWRAKGFGREFEMTAGHYSGDHLPGGFGAGLGVRQRLFWFGAARLSLAGAVAPGRAATISPISPIARADLLMGSGPLLPGFEPYGGLGLMWSAGTVTVDGVPTLGTSTRPSWVAGVKFAGFYAELQLDAGLDPVAKQQFALTERTVLSGGFCFPI